MQSCVIIQFLLLLLVKVEKSDGISSPIKPFTTYKNSAELERNVADLWWTVDDAEREIMFELHVKTTGWIALGISPAGGMSGADIGVGWVDWAGKVHFQDRYAFSTLRPVIDNTTTDWFHLQGREQNGWTSIQFKRLLDTCDSMDVSIRSGTNVLIFAYGLVDPDMSRSDGDIAYHDSRRGSRMIPLRSYGSPSLEEKFVELDSFEFRASNYHVPSDESTYYCKVYKAPNHFQTKRHAIAHKVLIDPTNRDLIHHMVVYECDPAATFDDANLPDDACDNVYVQVPLCMSNSASVWAIGGDDLEEFPEEAGYPVGGNFPVKYYVLEIHYDNPKRALNRTDSSGIRFYMGKELRQHDIGFLSFGTGPNPASLAIPPQVNRFIVDSYCDPKASQHLPESGITVLSAFPHTHLQGQSIWTKLIRNNKAVQYLFNAEAYNFNYQFENVLTKPIKLYRGDAFATRCVYNTMNKKEITLGGLRTKDEMCLHIFSYYPRMSNYYSCFTRNDMLAWQTVLNTSSPIIDNSALRQLLLDVKWTPALAIKWQEFYNNASRVNYFGSAGHFEEEFFSVLPKYEDLKSLGCKKQ
ncbi:unnamed protein product [Rotaria magnacalcarata]|uniref:DOMON domain-containing protein n=1 Tax=Rotaria magnacalcarata TaxID=392030 RepID=A0A814XR41_9BILA|nr:unnamed protein product [Rotaria magnacalcarata]